MCPLCISAVALVAGKVASGGGIAALTVRKLRHKPVVMKATKIQAKEDHNGN